MFLPFKAIVLAKRSDQTESLEAGDTVPADDQMIMDGDPHGAARFHDLSRDLDVRL